MNSKMKFLAQMPATIWKYTFYKDRYIFVDGYPHTKNFGDALGTPIVEFLSEKKILPSKNISRFLFKFFRFKNYAVVGSILQWIKKDSVVWGAGFIDNIRVGEDQIPSKVFAVRGPKTRENYLNQNIFCPEVFGDPALLLPLMYYPKISKKYKYGIIPHYFDFNHDWVIKMRARKDILIIDLMVYTNYRMIVEQILSCEKILSTSLHGLIVSDAYKIPNIHIKLSDKVVGGNFKFEDYYLSVHKDFQQPINPEGVDVDNLKFNYQEIQIDIKKLLLSCPFVLPEKRDNLIEKLQSSNDFIHLNREM